MTPDQPTQELSFSARSFIAGTVIHLAASALLAGIAVVVAFEGFGPDASQRMMGHEFRMHLIELIGWIWTPLSVAAVRTGSVKGALVVAVIWSLGVGLCCGVYFNGKKRFSAKACAKGMVINIHASALLAELSLWAAYENTHRSLPKWADLVKEAWILNPAGSIAFRCLRADQLGTAVLLSLGWSVMFGIACGFIFRQPQVPVIELNGQQ